MALRRATAFVLLAGLCTALGGRAAVWLGELGAVGFALCAGVGCLRASRRADDGARAGWTTLAVASWAWGAAHLAGAVTTGALAAAPGDRGGPTAADVAGLAFPVVALVAVCLLSPRSGEQQLPRRVLDALVVGCALALVAWALVGGAAAGPGGGSTGGSAVALAAWLARPIGDAVLLTVVVLTVAQDRRLPWRWALLAGAVTAMAASDVAVALLHGAGRETAGTVVGWGWWAGFCLLTTAGATVGAPPRPAPPDRGPDPDRNRRPGLLPYLPLVVATGAVAVQYSTRGRGLDGVGTALTVLLVALVLVRQYCVLRTNHLLARAVADREAELHRLAFSDALTGLANRALFLDRLGHALDLATREPRRVAVVFVDLDGFKAVNDTLGHAAGDELLVGVARRMRGAVRATDTLARLGGDEFAVLTEQGSDPAVVARTLLASLRRPFPVAGREVTISASIGVATAEPGAGADGAAALLHRADLAMYGVKTSGKDGVQVHSAAARTLPGPAAAPGHRTLAAAIELGALRTAYRPVVDTGHGRIEALEAVPHWTEAVGAAVPVGPLLRPGPPLTVAVLEQSCAQLARWSHQLGHHRLRVVVGVGMAELADPGLPARVDRILARHRLAPGQLTLQIDDRALPDRSSTAALDALHRLRHLGVRLGLGGLGSGYATLAWLSGAPLDTVKIDSELVADVDHDRGRGRLLHGVLALTRHLGLRSVADGVERTGQLVELRRLGCDFVQGHLVAGPATAAELTPVVLAQQPLLPRGLIGPSALPVPAPARPDRAADRTLSAW